MLTTDREKSYMRKNIAHMIKIIVSIAMSVHLLKEILLNMTSGAKRIVIIIDTLANGNMMIKKG